ncbi:small integral membrane protein 26-like [Neopsephotus bourkii]|uniref:small integral membrane protein 26-like n=1 Tax=Neopsephotus bourkii TaxID=309878 RepID=UPI002AA5A67E|nr:small integral membrane protein 26-like [Neopsephotus bourkii]
MAGSKLRLAVWNARAALLYSLGGWTMLGGILHYTKNRDAGQSGDASENKSDPQAKPALRQEIYTRETALGFTVTTVVTHREVEPPITQLLRRVKSYFYPDDSPPPEN